MLWKLRNVKSCIMGAKRTVKNGTIMEATTCKEKSYGKCRALRNVKLWKLRNVKGAKRKVASSSRGGVEDDGLKDVEGGY